MEPIALLVQTQTKLSHNKSNGRLEHFQLFFFLIIWREITLLEKANHHKMVRFYYEGPEYNNIMLTTLHSSKHLIDFSMNKRI